MKYINLMVLMFIYQLTLGQNINKYAYEIDRVSDEFILNLKKKEIDTIIVANYSFDNGRGNKATLLILWMNNGVGYKKGIQYRNENKYIEFPIIECSEVYRIINYYSEHKSDIMDSRPSSSSVPPNHDYGYCIISELLPSNVCARNYEINGDSEHKRSIWIKMIDEINREYLN